MKNARVKLIPICLALLVAGWIILKNKESAGSPPLPSVTKSSSSLNSVKIDGAVAPKSVQTLSGNVISSEKIEKIKADLLSCEKRLGGHIGGEFRTVVDAIITQLGFGADLQQIIDFTESRKLTSAKLTIELRIGALLRRPEASPNRAAMIQALNSSQFQAQANDWCGSIGEGCDSKEFEQFTRELIDKNMVRHLTFGRNQTLVKTDPNTAISSSLGFIEGNGLSTIHVFSALPNIIQELPSEADFPHIEQILSDAGTGHKEEMDSMISRLFTKWGEYDPASAANYALSAPDKFPPSLMRGIVSKFTVAHPAEALEWIQNFPVGPYFDEAAFTVISEIGFAYPDTAEELADLISDPKTKNESMKIIARLRLPGETK